MARSFHGLTAVASLKPWAEASRPGACLAFHGLTAVASLKLRFNKHILSETLTFHGLTAVASLKHRSSGSRDARDSTLPRPNSRGLIEALDSFVCQELDHPFHGLTAVASLKPFPSLPSPPQG